MYCVSPSSPPQTLGAGPQFPSPSPRHFTLIIKFSIFGVLASYFPGTERRSERDWKQPFVRCPASLSPSLLFVPSPVPDLPLCPNPILIDQVPPPPHHDHVHDWGKCFLSRLQMELSSSVPFPHVCETSLGMAPFIKKADGDAPKSCPFLCWLRLDLSHLCTSEHLATELRPEQLVGVECSLAASGEGREPLNYTRHLPSR